MRHLSSIILFRAPAEEDAYEESLRIAGWRPVSVPVLTYEAVRQDALAVRLASPASYSGVICTSPRASDAILHRLGASVSGWENKPAFVTGARTGRPFLEMGFEVVGVDSGGAEELARQIVAGYAGDLPLLYLSGSTRRDVLPDALRASRIPFEELVVYESRPVGDIDLGRFEEPAWVVFFSPMGVQCVRTQWPHSWTASKKAAIGETTAAAIRDAGWSVDALAATPAPESLCAALNSVAAYRVRQRPFHGGCRYTMLRGDVPLSYGEVIECWRNDAAFRASFISVLRDAPYPAYRWETPAVSENTIERPFEFVLIDAPELIRSADRYAFSEHFEASDDVAVFENLGRDAVLVAPAPCDDGCSYAHLAEFTRSAAETDNDALWRRVGDAMKERIGRRPIWLNTAGDGVAWLHVRLDERPKYYRYGPYRRLP